MQIEGIWGDYVTPQDLKALELLVEYPPEYSSMVLGNTSRDPVFALHVRNQTLTVHHDVSLEYTF